MNREKRSYLLRVLLVFALVAGLVVFLISRRPGPTSSFCTTTTP